jgi:hypothetical protein
MAAPILYRSVKIDRTTYDFWAAPIMSSELVASRKTRDKRFNLDYVQEVEYTQPEKWHCMIADSGYGSNSLSIQVSILEVIDFPFGTQKPCSCLRLISPLKVVTRGEGLRHPWVNDISATHGVETTAMMTEHVNGSLLEYYIKYLCGNPALKIRRSVFIRSPDRPPLRSFTPKVWHDIQYLLFQAARLNCLPSDITFVNIVDFTFLHRGNEDSTVEAATLTLMKAYHAFLEKEYDPNRERHKNNVYAKSQLLQVRNKEQAMKVKFSFITLETYLAEYDWKGEFTDEQVKRWIKEGTEGSGQRSDENSTEEDSTEDE